MNARSLRICRVFVSHLWAPITIVARLASWLRGGLTKLSFGVTRKLESVLLARMLYNSQNTQEMLTEYLFGIVRPIVERDMLTPRRDLLESRLKDTSSTIAHTKRRAKMMEPNKFVWVVNDFKDL